MTTKDEALRIALEALAHAITWLNICDKPKECMPIHAAITAIKQAQPAKDNTEAVFEAGYAAALADIDNRPVVKDGVQIGFLERVSLGKYKTRLFKTPTLAFRQQAQEPLTDEQIAESILAADRAQWLADNFDSSLEHCNEALDKLRAYSMLIRNLLNAHGIQAPKQAEQ